MIGNVLFAYISSGMTNDVAHAGAWALATFGLCTLLCLGLPKNSVGHGWSAS